MLDLDDNADLTAEVERLRAHWEFWQEHAKLWKAIAYRAAEVGDIRQAISDVCDRHERSGENDV